MAAANAQWQQHQTQVAQQQFAEYAKAEDAKFDELIKDEPEAVRQSIGKDMLAYAAKLGVNQEQMIGFLRTPYGRTAPVQRMLFDAVQYSRVKQAKATIAAQPPPPVMRPGTPGARPSSNQGRSLRLRHSWLTPPAARQRSWRPKSEQ